MKPLVRGIIMVLPLALTSTPAWSQSALLDAARDNDDARLHALLAKRADVNARGTDGGTPLLWAVHHGNSDAVRDLLRRRADANLANAYGVTPLIEAARSGNAEIFERLLAAGARPEVTVAGETPLMAAARTGSVPIIKLLLTRGVDVNAAEPYEGQTALMWATAEGHIDTVRVLLEAGAKPNARARPIALDERILGDQGRRWADWSRGGFTPLMFAARVGHLEIARLLLEHRADPRVKTPDNLTALILAVLNDALDVATLLVSRGADANDGSLYELIQLHNLRANSTAGDATRPRPDLTNEATPGQLAGALLDAGADPDRDIDYAVHTDGAAGGGAEVPAKRQSSWSLALQSRDVLFIKLMLAKGGADPDRMGSGDQIPLTEIFASPPRGGPPGGAPVPYRFPATRSSADAVAALLDAGADIDGTNQAGDTALHRAAQIGDLSVIELLAARGVQLEPKNRAGLTPLDLAMGKRPPRDPREPPPSQFAPPDNPAPEAVVLLRQKLGFSPLSADQLPRRAPPPVF